MRHPLIAGNWKMNGSRKSIGELVIGLVEAGPFECEVAVFPPFVFLDTVKHLLDGTDIRLGAQNVDWREQGAFTGEVSAPMLADIGCDFCIVGHSERRHLFAESDELVAQKFAACLAQSVTPVLCVGETLEQREADITMQVVRQQVDTVIELVDMQGLAAGIIAYEPVWAIGTGRTATPEQAEEVHAALREHLAKQDERVSASMRILYGGSVNGSNAADLLVKDNIDGALVGGASLKAKEFAAICGAAQGLMG